MHIIDLLQDPSYQNKQVLEKIICHLCSLTKEQLFIDTQKELTKDQVKKIQDAYQQYTTAKKPLEYILGYVEFLGVQFSVTPATLIPRPETEYMIQAVNEYLSIHQPTEIPPVKGVNSSEQREELLGGLTTDTSDLQSSTILLDIGTGCGVLGLSVLYHNPGKISHAYLTDLSPEALEVAKGNHTHLFGKQGLETLPTTSGKGGHVTSPTVFLQSNLLQDQVIQKVLQTNQDILVVANLPYIPDQLFDDNPDERVKKREPRMAFVGGNDGLDLYRIMFDQLIETQKEKHYREHDGHILHEKGLTWTGGHIPYKKELKERARALRKNMTKAEKKLWYDFLKSLDITINRQKIIDGYIVDFYIASTQLVIEIDGESHYTDEALAYDQQRTAVLEQYSIRVIRYTNEQVYTDFDAVCEDIMSHIKSSASSVGTSFDKGGFTSSPLCQRGAGEDCVGGNITLFLEMMTRQVDILRKEYEHHFTFEEVKTFHFNIRIVKAILLEE